MQEIVRPNRIFRWCTSPTAIEIEGDPRHAEILVSQANLGAKSSGVITPGVKPTSADLGDALNSTDATAYRSRVMRGSYLAECRPDIKYSCREDARLMKAPSTVGMEILKRTARFLVTYLRWKTPTSYFW